MLLHELAEATGVSAASIKYYRREGLLPPGERITTTRQDYGRAHVERLELIQVLREVAGAPIARIARVTALLGDPDVPLIEVLAESQTLSLGLEDPTDEESARSEEHTSELQSREKLVCRLLLEKKKKLLRQ